MTAFVVKRISLKWMEKKPKLEAFVGSGIHFEFSIRKNKKVSVRIRNKSSMYPKSLQKFNQGNK